MTIRKVWIVQLSPEWKARFEEIAKKEGDTSHGNGARQVKRALQSYLSTKEK